MISYKHTKIEIVYNAKHFVKIVVICNYVEKRKTIIFYKSGHLNKNIIPVELNYENYGNSYAWYTYHLRLFRSSIYISNEVFTAPNRVQNCSN